MKLLLIIFLLSTTACNNVSTPVTKNVSESSPACQVLDFMKLQNKNLQDDFFRQLDSVRRIQYPGNDQEKEIMIDINPTLLTQFLRDIDQKALLNNGQFEKEYHFNIAPKGYSDPKKCTDKISIEFYPDDCGYRMVIWDTFLAEPGWCTESQVIYSFEIRADQIMDFHRNEAG